MRVLLLTLSAVALMLPTYAGAQEAAQCTTNELDLICEDGNVLQGITSLGQKICVALPVLIETPSFLTASVGIAGGNSATFEVDFKDGSANLLTYSGATDNWDSNVKAVNYQSICASGEAGISFVSASETNLFPNYDSSSSFKILQAPSCENDLIATFKISDDQCCSSNVHYSLQRTFTFSID